VRFIEIYNFYHFFYFWGFFGGRGGEGGVGGFAVGSPLYVEIPTTSLAMGGRYKKNDHGEEVISLS
jgi:hypothetical protein